MAKKGMIFWNGAVLIVAGVLSFINLGIISQFAGQILPYLAIVGGIYIISKE